MKGNRSIVVRFGLARYSLFSHAGLLVRESAGFNPGMELELGRALQYHYRGQEVTAVEVTRIRLPATQTRDAEDRAPAYRTFVLARDLATARA